MEEVNELISYDPFFKTLKKKNISQYKLINDYGFSKGTLDSLRNNRSITLNTLEDICKLLKCEPQDIFIFKPDK